MELASYWKASAPAFDGGTTALPSRCDVAIVGAGFTGLSAALALAQRGASVLVLEAGDVAAEASGRNGGHVNSGLAVDYAELAARVGIGQAVAWHRAFNDAVDTVERLVREHAIDCDFARRGKLKLAARPAHYDAIARAHERLHAEADPSVQLVGPSAVKDEIASARYHGGLLYPKSAQMHMGRFGVGLARAAERAGARIATRCTVERLERQAARAHRLHTARGTVQADQVLLATGATRHGAYGSFGWWRRRLVPVGSFIVVTEPLGRDRALALLPQRRTYTTTENIHNYFRLTEDDRLVFGGRARFAMSNPTSDRRSGAVLQAALERTFPQLAGVRLDYCWGGLVDMTRDRLPRAGEHDGLFYAMGYSGHGAQMSVHMGQCMARVLSGEPEANPWRALAWPAIPGHLGPPWFLPAVGLYYRLKDRWG